MDVFDRYEIENAIKSAERERRSLPSEGHRVYQVNEGSAIPDCRIFLANTKNKMALVSFIGEFILNSYCVKQPLFDGYILFLAGAFCNPEVVKKVVRNQAIDCVSLF